MSTPFGIHPGAAVKLAAGGANESTDGGLVPDQRPNQDKGVQTR